MSLRAILEVVVHLDTFRNIDLFFQGLYYIKVSVYNKRGDEVSTLKYPHGRVGLPWIFLFASILNIVV
jgi:hypothetical protein